MDTPPDRNSLPGSNDPGQTVTPTLQTRPRARQAIFGYLQEQGAHFVLCDGKRPIWKGWQRRRPPVDVVLAHDGNVGLLPASIEATALDVDRGDPAELLAHHPAWADLPSRRRGGHHLYYPDHTSRDNGTWEAYGCAGEVRSGRGFLVLWRDGPQRLAEAVRHGPSGVRFPADLSLFAAAGMVLPVQYAPDATRGEVEAIRPRRLGRLENVLPGPRGGEGWRGRNVAMFDATRWWAYAAWWEWDRADLAGWNAAVLERAQRNNERFPVPLPDEREVRRTAYSISTWIASGGGPAEHDPVKFSERQAARARKLALVRRGILPDRHGHLRADVYYRDLSIIADRAEGYSIRAIAERQGVSRGCVENVLRRSVREGRHTLQS